MITNQNQKNKGGTELMYDRINKVINLKQYNVIPGNNITESKQKNNLIYWCHDLPGDPMYDNINLNSHFIFVSNYQKQLFIKHYNLQEKNCIVIENGIVPFLPHKKDNSICRIIYHTTPHRGLDILVNVFQKLVPFFIMNKINVHLDVYSSLKIYNRPDLDVYFEKLYTEIKNNPYMTYHGCVSNDKIREALMNSHIFAYPSTFKETSCMSLIEAMSAGCLCVHSSLAALSETSNNLTMMYEYTSDRIKHCNRFADTLIKAVFQYKSFDVTKQIKYVNQKYNIENIIKKWKNYLHILT